MPPSLFHSSGYFVHLIPHISEIIWYLSFSAWFISLNISTPDPSMLLQKVRFPSFICSCSIPLCKWNTFLKILFYLILERGRETLVCERNINWLPLACPQLGAWASNQACALTGNWTDDLLVLRPALNPLSHTNQGPQLFLSTDLLKGTWEWAQARNRHFFKDIKLSNRHSLNMLHVTNRPRDADL